MRPGWLRGGWLVWHGSAIAVGFVVHWVGRAGAARAAGRSSRHVGSLADGGRRVRQAALTLARQPLHAVTAALTLALGVGVSTAVFTVVWHGLVKSLPYADAGRLLRIGDRGLDDPAGAFSSMSMQNVLDLRVAARSLAGLETFAYEQYNVTGDGGPVRVLGMMVSPGFFDLLGVRPSRGRFFDGTDIGAGTVVLSQGAWRDEFGSDPEIVGRTVMIDRIPRRIIGILPASFSFPATPRLFTVLDESAPVYSERRRRTIDGVARLRDGVGLERARQELESIFGRLALAHPQANEGWTVGIAPLSEWMIGRTRKLVGLFSAATVFVLLIACTNVAGLSMARAQDRAQEFAVRSALGAGRSRIASDLLSENLLLGLVGAGLGVLLAAGTVRLLLALYGSALPRPDEIAIDPLVLLFAVCLSVMSSLVAGLVPALRAASGAVAAGLRSTRGHSRSIARQVLVVGEIALAVVLAAGAGLMINSVIRLTHVDLGIDRKDALVFAIGLPAASYDSPQSILAFYDNLLERLETVPRVVAAAAASRSPLRGGTNGEMVAVGRTDPRPHLTEMREVTPGYFDALGVPLVLGRGLFTSDQRSGHNVVVNHALASSFFGGDALGQHIRFDDSDETWEIVGIVSDIAEFGPDRPARPTVYWPYGNGGLSTTSPMISMNVIVRSSANPIALLPEVRAIVRDLDPDLPIHDVARLADLAAAAIGAQRRSATSMLSALALLAVLLGAVGVHGVVSFAVSRRIREMGVRLALGATPSRLLAHVMGRGVRLAVFGVAIGSLAALAAARLLAGMLYGVSPADPVTFGAVAATLVAVTVVASAAPAVRAARVQAADSMRLD